MSLSITQVMINDSSDKTISGSIKFNRSGGGILVVPSGGALPSEDVTVGEWFWLTTTNTAYRRNDANDSWVAQVPSQHSINSHSDTLSHGDLSSVGADDHHAHSNKTQLDAITDGDHDVATDNPHGVTAAQIGASTAIIQISESMGGQVIGDYPPQSVVIRSVDLNTDESVFDYENNSEVIFSKAGIIKMDVSVSIEHVVGGGRTNGAMAIMYKPSAGSYGYINGTTRYVYVRSHAGSNLGSMTASFCRQVDVGDRAKVVSWRESGNDTIKTISNACSINALWVG